MNTGFQNNKSRTVEMGNWGLHVCSRSLLRVMSLTVAPPLRLEEPVGYIRWCRVWLECKHWHTWQCGIWSPVNSLQGFWQCNNTSRYYAFELLSYCFTARFLKLGVYAQAGHCCLYFAFEFLFWFLLNERLSLLHYGEGWCDVAGCQRGQSFSWSWYFVVSAQLNGWPW